MLVGREQELQVLAEMYAAARGGRRTVALWGGAGIGKTSIVDAFLSSLPAAVAVGAVGDPGEKNVPLSAVDELQAWTVDARGGRGTVRSDSALDVTAAVDLVCHAVRAAAPNHAAVLWLDDLQWFDEQSMRVMALAVEQLASDPVLVVMSGREERARALPKELLRACRRPLGARIDVGPLSREAAVQLVSLTPVAGCDAPGAVEAWKLARGNALYLTSLIDDGASRVAHSVKGHARELASANITARLDLLSPAARGVVEAASVLGETFSLEEAMGIAQAGRQDGVRGELVDAELLLDEPSGEAGRAMFPNDAVCATVYEHMLPSRRAALHRAAAAVARDSWERLRHRAAAVFGVDEALGDELADFAEREREAGRWSTAAMALLEAVRIGRTSLRERAQLDAVYCLLFQGDVVRGVSHRSVIEGLPASPRRDTVLGFMDMVEGSAADAERLFDRAWSRWERSTDPTLGLTIARLHALHSMHRLRGPETVMWSERGRQVAADGGGDRTAAEMMPLGVGLAYSGRPQEGLAVVDRVVQDCERSPKAAPSISLKRTRGWLKYALGDLAGAYADLSEEAAVAIDIGSHGTAIFALGHLAIVEYLTADWQSGLAHARQALDLNIEVRHPFGDVALFAAAMICSAQGAWSDLEEHLALRGRAAGGYEATVALRALARASRAAAQGAPDEVIAALRPILEIAPREGIEQPGFWPWQHVYADALIAVGRCAEAEALLERHAMYLASCENRVTLARFACSQGRLYAARGDAARSDAFFETGTRHATAARLLFETAVIQFAWAQALRRRGQRRSASELLRAAGQTFAELDARPFIERCEVELRACALRPSSRSAFDRDRLTPQELAVAKHVASGLTNRAVASLLAISVSTVEFHLTRIYTKLGIASRTQLASMANHSDGEAENYGDP